MKTTDDNNDENFQSTNEYDEEMEVDYPIFTETILEHDEEPFDMRKFQKYYTGFLWNCANSTYFLRISSHQLQLNFHFCSILFLKL